MTPFVPTDDLREAARGRGLEVLRALGIRPPGKGHMTCPYPQHGGKNDWRWDKEKGAAFCTCTRRDDIFHVVMKVKGFDFAQAKIFVAEAIGRHDLVQPRRGFDVRSLLAPPANVSDNKLPRAYLAHRLRVRAEAVPMPDTPFAGWRALPYWENGKVIARPPCVVWGLEDSDGNQHALRVWVRENGAGKADLGAASDGGKRVVKKAAKARAGEITSGRVVRWGQITALHLILCEGVETAAAAAFAYKAEIEAGEVMICAAGSAGSMEAHRPWPCVTRVTCAADRDEYAENGKTPSRRGERAALAFAARNPGLEVLIAMPGAAGTKADWADIHLERGAKAVRDGISKARPCVRATLAEVESSNLPIPSGKTHGYPILSLNGVRLRYKSVAGGKLRLFKEVRDREGNLAEVPVSSPVGVRARLKYPQADSSYGIRVILEGMDGQPSDLDIDRADLAASAGRDILARLYAAGLRVENDGEKVVVAALKAADPLDEIVVVKQAGWHEIGDRRFFVCPNGQAFGGEETVELDRQVRLASRIAQRGSLDGWKAAIEAACSADNTPHWRLGITAGFAGVVLGLAGLDTCGMLFSGLTSLGKTIAQRLATSSFSRPSEGGGGLFQSARSTANAQEHAAAKANGTALVLDELAHVPGKELARIVYALCGNVGKARMTADARLRPQLDWRTFVLMSAERGLSEMIAADGGRMPPGVGLRIVDIDVTDVNRHVDQGVLKAIMGINDNYGHAGPEFVSWLKEAEWFERGPELKDMVHQASASFDGAGASGALTRAAVPFAILRVTGALLAESGLVPMSLDAESATKWAWSRYRMSAECEALKPEEAAISSIREWIARNWGYKIHRHLDANDACREAWAWYDNDYIYVPSTEVVKAAGGVLKEREIAAALDRAALIAKRKSQDCNFVSYVPRIGKIKAYALLRAEMGPPPDEAGIAI